MKSGTELNCEIVILAMGVRPEVELADKAELEIGTTGGIRVNENLQTSDANIYAIGDAIEVKDLSQEMFPADSSLTARTRIRSCRIPTPPGSSEKSFVFCRTKNGP